MDMKGKYTTLQLYLPGYSGYEGTRTSEYIHKEQTRIER